MSAEDCVGCRHINNCLGDCVGYEQTKGQTNEEWLRSATTEQLAEWIIGIDYGADDKDIKIAKLVEWLKQPH